MTDWSTHTTIEINRLQEMKEKELLARTVYLLDRILQELQNQELSIKCQSGMLKDIEKLVRRK